MTEARAPRNSLSAMLRIDDHGGGAYGATLESFWGGAAPGDLLARATLAATAGRRDNPTALHAALLRKARPDVEISLATEDLAADRRRVRAHQKGDLLCDVVFRFGPDGAGLTYQCVAPEPGLAAPEELPSEAELGAIEGWAAYAVGPVESRRVGERAQATGADPAVWLGWLRPREALPNDARLHAAAVVFLSEYRSHWAVERRLGADFPHTDITVLDHALWVHRAEPWDDFWLVKTWTDVGVKGRCFSRREIYNRGGALLASAAWEASLRQPGASA